MADNPQTPGNPAAGRPLSPHLTIYRWPATMMTSITHRITGVGLAVGILILAWWLIAISTGPDGWNAFHAVMNTPPGLLVLFGIAWALGYHLLSGLRHLAWDLGYGFDKTVAERNSILVFGLSFLIAAGIFVLVWTGHAGYLQ